MENDNKKELSYYQQLNLKATLILGLVMAASSPLIHVYMIQSISTDFYKLVAFLNELLLLFVFFVLDKRDEDGNPKVLKRLRVCFVPVVVVGCLVFVVANLTGMFDVRIRFLILCTVDGVVTYLWKIAMNDLWNNLISGTDLTAWINKCGKYDRLGAIVGATAIHFVNLSVEIALMAQCIAYIYMGYCDYRIYKGTKHLAYPDSK